VTFEIIRDPLWNNIPIDPLALRLVGAPAFQRLRYVRQLGLAFLVYPGATHTRFEHALGTYHLARRAISILDDDGALAGTSREACQLVRVAALLHDVGHYPFSHALEELGALHHEEVARPLITEGEVARLLRAELGESAPEDVMCLIRGVSDSPLQRLISGSLDLDKLDYLRRDALMCGVPYGEIDVDRLLYSLTLIECDGRREIGMVEKGLAALESLLFARYQMYRNVYWHHAVRSATVMYKRLVEDAVRAGSLDAATLAAFTDEGLLHNLTHNAPSPLLDALRARRLYKRALQCPAADLESDAAEWIADDRMLTRAVESALERELGLAPGELLLDYPVKTQMLGLDLPVLRRDGIVQRLTTQGWEGAIDLPRLSEQLYRSARWLRVFTARRMSLPRAPLLDFLSLPAQRVRELLDRDAGLLN
jgi:hypothetical protein